MIESNNNDLDNSIEFRKLNFNVHHKPFARAIIEKISKKFDPYQYFKKEYLQSHQNKSEDDIEKVINLDLIK
jgi:hypothetical protein